MMTMSRAQFIVKLPGKPKHWLIYDSSNQCSVSLMDTSVYKALWLCNINCHFCLMKCELFLIKLGSLLIRYFKEFFKNVNEFDPICICSNMNNRNLTGLVLIDPRKAFDMINHDIWLRKVDIHLNDLSNDTKPKLI